MEIVYNNCVIFSTRTIWGEEAWKITDMDILLTVSEKQSKIILGGDILDKDLNYTYDSWYYNSSSGLNVEQNSAQSIQKAKDYISIYQKRNGDSFYVVVVFKKYT